MGFNSALDFHPDHIYIPLLIWAFYFAEKDRYVLAIILAGIGAMAKEPLILGAVFFGLYLIIGKKQYRMGIFTILIFLILFYVVIFIILPYTNKSPAFQDSSFPFLENSKVKAGLFDIKYLINSLMTWKIKKLLFIYFLLAPLLFLPFLDWRRFLPAIPLIIIPMLSTAYLHSSIDSQYTAGIIGPAFVALIFSLKRIGERYGLNYIQAFLTFLIITTFTFNLAHGAGPFSISFWRQGWAEIWHRSNFTSGEHEKVLEEAILKIPEDTNLIVGSQGNLNHSRLAHRYNLYTYPYKWEEADYILLDTNKPPMVGDRVDKELFMKELQRIKGDSEFQLEFHKDGVLIFKRTQRAKGS